MVSSQSPSYFKAQEEREEVTQPSLPIWPVQLHGQFSYIFSFISARSVATFPRVTSKEAEAGEAVL
jgi:hypothetical protein